MTAGPFPSEHPLPSCKHDTLDRRSGPATNQNFTCRNARAAAVRMIIKPAGMNFLVFA